jgi:hypothetical protein
MSRRTHSYYIIFAGKYRKAHFRICVFSSKQPAGEAYMKLTTLPNAMKSMIVLL